MSKENPLEGLRAVPVYRCSDPKQIADSIKQQRKSILKFIEEHGMVLVHEEYAEAVSASVEDHKAIIYGLRDKKLDGELDFNVLLFWDWSRFTRTGTLDGNRIIAELADDEIMVVTVKDGALSGKEGWIKLNMALRESEAYGETVAVNVSRGYQEALEAGEIPHCTIAPYGTDRMYTTDDGKPLFLLRNLGKGQKVKLHPESRAELERLSHSAHCPAVTKRSTQKIVLVKGPREEIAVVNDIFARRYLEGWGSSRIVRDLNSRGIPGPRGKRWCKCTVERMVRNELYIGMGHANQNTTGVYAKRAPNQPVQFEVRRKPGRRRDKRGRRKNVPPIARPYNEWLGVDYSDLDDFLDENVREAARIGIERERKRPKKKYGDRHYKSDYILKGILTTKQENLPMTGLPSKGNGRLYRYYSLHRVINSPKDNDMFKTRLPAGEAEHHVLSALATVLQCPTTIGAGIRSYVQRRLRETNYSERTMNELAARKQQALDEYETIFEVFGKHGREAMKARAAQLEARIDDITKQIEAMGKPLPFRPDQVEQIINSVTKQCGSFVGLLGERSSAALRRLLQLFVSKMTFDVVTKEVEIEIGLPSWALSVEKKLQEDLRLATDHAVGRGRETQIKDVVFLAKFGCFHQYIKRQPCFTCCRTPLAA